MSSIVSRRPPPSGPTSQAKDFFWMSIRLGTSRTLSIRAKLRRMRGASTEAKTATPPQEVGNGGERATGRARGIRRGHTKIAQGYADPRARGARLSRTPSGPAPVCGGKGAVDGCGYRPSARQLTPGPWDRPAAADYPLRGMVRVVTLL